MDATTAFPGRVPYTEEMAEEQAKQTFSKISKLKLEPSDCREKLREELVMKLNGELVEVEYK